MSLLRWAVISLVIVSFSLANMVVVYAVFNLDSIATWFPAWSILTFVTTIIVLGVSEQ